METSEEIKKEFLYKLQTLLSSYNASNTSLAEIYAEDHWRGYSECGSDIRMTVYIPAIYDNDGNTLRENTEIDLGTWIDGKTHGGK